MYFTAVRRCMIVAGLVTLSARAAHAQCADGSPPPCRGAAPAPAPSRSVALDENLIAIFPFRITGTSPDAAPLREGAMDLLALALDEQAGLRVVASRTLLARARGFTDASSIADAAAIARSLGAGAMILGNAVVIGTQVRARAELHDLMRNRQPASVEARGVTADPAPVIDSLAFSLARVRLAAGAGTVRRSIAEFASTSPAALRLYLAGERLARRGLWQEAADSLLGAIGLDSSFALAMYRLRVVNSFGGNIAPWTATTLMQRALRSLQRLPRRQGDLLQTAIAQVEGSAREAVARADGLGTRYPDDPEVAYEQGEAYYHMGLALGVPAARALEPFERAIRMDSTLIDPYNHAVELRVVTGDTGGALALARRAAALAPRSLVHQAVMLTMRVIGLHEEPAAAAAQTPRIADQGSDVVGRAAYEALRMLSQDPARGLRLAEAFYRIASGPAVTPSQRVGNLADLTRVLIAQGRLPEARATLDQVGQMLPGNAAESRLRLIASLVDGAGIANALAQVIERTPRPGLQSLGLMGVAAVKLRRAGLLDSVIAGLEDVVRREPITGHYSGALVATLRGLDALSRADTASAYRLLSEKEGVFPVANLTARFEDATQWGVIALAEIDLARGQTELALQRMHFFNFANGSLPTWPAADALRARILARARP